MSESPFLSLYDVDRLRGVQSEPLTISVDEISAGGPRTLIWGYTTDRYDFHVFYDGEVIRRVVIDGSFVVCESEGATIEVNAATPGKRIYPERCDRTFCELIAKRGGTLPFTTYSERTSDGPFFGPTEW